MPCSHSLGWKKDKTTDTLHELGWWQIHWLSLTILIPCYHWYSTPELISNISQLIRHLHSGIWRCMNGAKYKAMSIHWIISRIIQHYLNQQDWITAAVDMNLTRFMQSHRINALLVCLFVKDSQMKWGVGFLLCDCVCWQQQRDPKCARMSSNDKPSI